MAHCCPWWRKWSDSAARHPRQGGTPAAFFFRGRGRRGGGGGAAAGCRPRHAVQRRMRQKLRSPAGRAVYGRRKAVVEPVLGVLKQQRGMRQFRMRGKNKVEIEWTLAAVAYNLTHLYQLSK